MTSIGSEYLLTRGEWMQPCESRGIRHPPELAANAEERI